MNSKTIPVSCYIFTAGSWNGIKINFRDPRVLGCSTEGHISQTLSDRMSSRPMSWSREGTEERKV